MNGRVDIVLIEPQATSNIGAVVRAMRNFDLENLILVRPSAWEPETARWMAPGCDDLVDKIRVVAEIDDALQNVGAAYATTARHRRSGQPVFEPKQLAQEVQARPERVAILFGREDSGLDNRTVERCRALVRIPTGAHASLNLSAAVLLVCSALFDERRNGQPAPGRSLAGSRPAKTTASVQRTDARDGPASLSDMEPLVVAWTQLLDTAGTTQRTDANKIAATTRRLLQRAQPSLRDVDALRGALRDLARGSNVPGQGSG